MGGVSTEGGRAVRRRPAPAGVPERSPSAVVVGAGHNSLVAATLLARSGVSVTVLERRATVGGAAVSTQPFAGVDVRISNEIVKIGVGRRPVKSLCHRPGTFFDDVGDSSHHRLIPQREPASGMHLGDAATANHPYFEHAVLLVELFRI